MTPPAPRLLAASGLLLVLGAAAGYGLEAGQPLAVRDVRVESIAGGRRVTITLTRPPEGLRGSTVDKALQLVIDVDGPAEAGSEARFPVTDDVVTAVRVAPRAGGLRVVLDLSREPGPSSVRAAGADVIADLGETYVTKPVGVGLEGRRVKLTGRWVEQHFEASKVIARDSRKDPRRGRVTGQIDTLGPEPHTFRVGPLVVRWSDSTHFVGLSADGLVPGAAVEATGPLGAPAYLVADTIEAAKPGRGEILGAVTAEEHRDDGSLALTVLGVEVIVPAGVSTEGADLTRRLDEKRPDTQLTVSVLGRPLTIGGELQAASDYKGNFDLDDTTQKDKLEMDNHIELEALYFFTPRVLMFAQARAVYAPEFELGTGMRTDTKDVERREHWLFVGDIAQSALGPGYSVQVGRQKFQEVREWWWDRDLDAFRFHYDRPQVHAELAFAQELAPDSTLTPFTAPDEHGVFRNLGSAAWGWKAKQRFDFFYLYQNDHSGQRSVGLIVPQDREDTSDADLLWLGARASGEVDWDTLGDLYYGVDGAWVGGNETVLEFENCQDIKDFNKDAGENGDKTKVPCPRNKRDPAHERLSSRSEHDVSGFAVDARGTLATTAPGRPALTLGYAFGSGNPGDSFQRDRSFRQTALQRDNDRFLGVDRFRYYGELLRPELSNLHIFTVALGYRIMRSSSVELLYHYYRQATPAPFLRDAKIKADPNGKDSSIGNEWDLALGLEEWEHLEVELIGSLFRAGSAYGSLSGNLAEGVFLKLKYNF